MPHFAVSARPTTRPWKLKLNFISADGHHGEQVMRYLDFKAAIRQHLQQHRTGATWLELRDALSLPYDRPCPEWTHRLENEIGLIRCKGSGRALVWKLSPAAASQTKA